ncbi:MAG TPA: metal-dependent transcriptional regulator [Aggregatilineales bacterium]|nr:metal-dependent transcriptional regulator [Aggregatilineales bacterium]
MSENLADLRRYRTESIDHFLKAVYHLQQQVDPVPTTLLAQYLKITAPSVTDMVKRLAGVEDDKPRKDKEGEKTLHTPLLLEYLPYKGVRLTPDGEKIALEVIRHHRLIELYLYQALGYTWDEVHDEADRLEHVISEQLEARIAAALGDPRIDPHGDPIPALDGTIAARDLVLLSELPAHQEATVSRIIDQSPEVLRYLSDLGLTPGAGVEVLTRSPLNDTLTLRVASGTYTISTQVAHKVLMTMEGKKR